MQKILKTSAESADAAGVYEPIELTKNLRLPQAPHSERNAFIGAGYWFFCRKVFMLFKSGVNFVLVNAKYASRTGAVPNLFSP